MFGVVVDVSGDFFMVQKVMKFWSEGKCVGSIGEMWIQVQVQGIKIDIWFYDLLMFKDEDEGIGLQKRVDCCSIWIEQNDDCIKFVLCCGIGNVVF